MDSEASHGGPVVSVIMANFNGAAFIADAVNSVRNQSLANIEIIIVDDGSSDGSLAIVAGIATEDTRVRLVARLARGGPAAARNTALAAARGEWIAVVDSDDLIHPERLERLVAAAAADGADIAADDLLIFSNDRKDEPDTLFRRRRRMGPAWVSLAEFISSNTLYGGDPALGFTKPLIRRSALAGVSYDEALTIAEDYDLLARLLRGGAKMRTYPDLLYFYRKHSASISYRLDEKKLLALAANAAAFAPTLSALTDKRAMERRDATIKTSLAFIRGIDHLKRRDLGAAAAVFLRRPAALALLRQPILDNIRRLAVRRTCVSAPGPDVVVLSRQRVVGATNGSSAYLLDIVRDLRKAGRSVRFVGPSPAMFGRWPILRLRSEMAMFEAIAVRGGLRLGDFVIAKDPSVGLRALATVAEFLLVKIGVLRRARIKAAPNTLSIAASREEQVFVAQQCFGGRLVIADYAFVTPLLPYCLSPSAGTAVIMHDLYSQRALMFAGAGAKDSTLQISPEREFSLLGRADVVIAIQRAEADTVSARLPHQRVIVAPISAHCAKDPSPGEDDSILFVGTNTPPNVIGLKWFFDEAWPHIRAARPTARVTVVGNIDRAFPQAPDGARFIGVQPTLSGEYEKAGIVISPLTLGSGLKIKLVEALARGKAVVATPATMQGLPEDYSGAVAVCDRGVAFADEVLALVASREKRAQLGRRALMLARRDFSAEVSYRDLRQFAAESA